MGNTGTKSYIPENKTSVNVSKGANNVVKPVVNNVVNNAVNNVVNNVVNNDSKITEPDMSRITEKDGFRVVNIQNLKKKDDFDDYEKGNTFSELTKVQILSKNFKIKQNDIYFYRDTSCGKRQMYKTNNFIGSFLEAYNTHSDAVLNPDSIWIMISLFFSKYVDKNAQKLRKRFVVHEGQKKLVIKEYANNVEESLRMEREWDYFYEQMHKEIKKNTLEGVVDSLACDFSTTGVVEKIISTAVIMNSFKQYFSYGRAICMCGINNIYFQGIRNDWVKLIDKTSNLAQYDVDGVLKKYVDHVLIILKQFLNTWDGRVDVQFWNNIMAVEEKRIGSGSDVQTKLEGWIIHFFGIYSRIDLDDVPDYSISVPVELVNEFTNTTKDLNLVANWSSVSQVYEDVFKPDLGLTMILKKDDK